MKYQSAVEKLRNEAMENGNRNWDKGFGILARFLRDTLVDSGEFDEAAVEFEKSIEVDPKFGIAYLNLATALESLGKHKEAAEARKKANELSGSH